MHFVLFDEELLADAEEALSEEAADTGLAEGWLVRVDPPWNHTKNMTGSSSLPPRWTIPAPGPPRGSSGRPGRLPAVQGRTCEAAEAEGTRALVCRSRSVSLACNTGVVGGERDRAHDGAVPAYRG